MIELSMAFCFVIRGLVPSRITDVHWITLSGVLCIERLLSLYRKYILTPFCCLTPSHVFPHIHHFLSKIVQSYNMVNVIVS